MGNENKPEIEYQKTQDSAEHHDALLWTTVSIIWAGNLVLLGFVLNNIKNPDLRIILTHLSIFGIILAICMYIFALLFNSIIKQKYDRCKKLEDILGFEQHKKLKYPSGVQKSLLIITTIAFVLIWISTICTIW